MRSDKKIKRGTPTGNVYVIFSEALYGTPKRGNNVSFTVSHTTAEELANYCRKKILEDRMLPVKFSKRKKRK